MGVVFGPIVEREAGEVVFDLVGVVGLQLGRRCTEGEVGDEFVKGVVVHASGVEEAVVGGVVGGEEGGEGGAG